MAGLRTTVGTEELDNVPTADGAVAARLRAAGANIIGHTNVAAWLADHQSSNPVFGRTSNPWDPSRTAGGSSGGAAAAVASGMTPAEVGSDMVGSVRQPASFCGVYGLKPTEHRVPLTGFYRAPDGSPRPVRILASLGPLARSLDDIELLLSIICGPDGFDADVPQHTGTPIAAHPSTSTASRSPYHEQGFVFAMSNLTGLPGLALPAGFDPDGIPAGIQLIGRRWSEATLLSIGRGLESASITPGFRRPRRERTKLHQAFPRTSTAHLAPGTPASFVSDVNSAHPSSSASAKYAAS